MKKIIIATIIFSVYINNAAACPLCGCGTGNYYIGLLPQFNKHFVGLRYQYNNFKTNIKDEPGEFSKDRFQSVELWGGWNIGKRWQALAIVPFNFVHQVSDEGAINRNGIGDIMLMGNYKLFDKTSSTKSKKLISQQLWLGAGIKLSTGSFSIDPADEMLVALANTQTGSASTDFIVNGMYNISINKFGINTGARYKINTQNKDKYFFGNKFSANSLAYYSFKNKQTTLTPNAGFLYEHNGASKLENEKIDFTGGYLLSTAAGLEVNIKKVTLGCNVQLPITQNFAGKQTQNKLKGMFHVTLGF